MLYTYVDNVVETKDNNICQRCNMAVVILTVSNAYHFCIINIEQFDNYCSSLKV